ALIPFADHPVPAVRRAAVGPALASGHPDALVKLKALEQDPDEGVQTAARAAAQGLAATAPPLVVSMLGRFSIRRGAWVVDETAWGRPLTARLVRFLLVHRGSLVPEDLLFEAFWPDRSAAAARRNLQVAVSRARQVLDPPGREESTIEVVDRSYVLQLGDQDLIDVDEFDAVASAALADRGPSRLALIERAHALWGGEPLPEDRYAEWAVAWRERIVDRYIELLGALVEAYSAAGDHAAAIQAARELVDLDPLNEHAHRELMASYARAGRTGHALRQYLECRRTLIDELGVEPAEATSVLQARILAGQPV
ncbi:MAG: winged helix-turn-helix domain-containing protein, partial [Chloroflexota bacterium]|nr:winged helix-turn-helix domain-containing protein [Chloroflexota bacterium]